MPRSIYACTQDQAGGGTVSLFALDATNGSLRWQKDYRASGGWSLQLDRGILYHGATGVNVEAINPDDGATIWRSEVTGVPAVLSNGTLYLQDNTWPWRVYALRAQDGAEVWRAAPGVRLPPTPFASEASVFLQPGADLTRARASDGATIWRFSPPSHSQDGYDAAQFWTVGHNHTYAVYWYEWENRALYALHETDGTVAWRFPAMALDQSGAWYERWYVETVGVDGDSVYLFTNDGDGFDLTSLYALDPENGSAQWRVEFDGAAFGFGQLRHGALFVTTPGTGEIIAIEPENGSVRWRQRLPTHQYADGALAQMPPHALNHLGRGRVYLNSPGIGLFALDDVTGEILWQYREASSVRVIAASEGNAYLSVTNPRPNPPPQANYLCALRESDQTIIWQYNTPTLITTVIADE